MNFHSEEIFFFAQQGKGKMLTYWLIGARGRKDLSRGLRSSGKQLMECSVRSTMHIILQLNQVKEI